MPEGIVVERAQETNVQCRHYWVIDAAGGPTSKGVCRLCGAQKQFKNFLDDAPWEDDKPAVRDHIKAVVPAISSLDSDDDE